MASAKRILWHVWQSAKHHRWLLLSTFAIWGVIIGLTDVFGPTIIQRMIDGLSSEAPPSSVFGLFILYAGILITGQVLFRIFDYVMVAAQIRIIKRMQDYAFARIIDHDYRFFIDSFAGSIVAKVKRYARGFERIHDLLVFQFLSALVVIIGISVVLVFNEPILAAIFFGWFVIFVGVTLALTPRKVRLDLTRAAQDSKVTGALADALTNALTIITFARSSREQRRFEQETDEQRQAMGNAWYYNNLVMAIQSVLLTVLEIAALWGALHFYYAGAISLGTVVLVQTYVFMIFAHVWRLGRAFSDLLQAGTDMDEMVELMDAPIAINDPDTPVKARIERGEIVFANVGFGYHDERVFEGLDLRIGSGERVGIVGTSGAGKSTLTKLLLRFVDVNDGSIMIDGIDIRDMRLDDLRSSIAYVPQEPILFHRSLEENIRYGKPNASKKQVIVASMKAHAHEFIEKLPEGYGTLVGERGVKLSGGERQRAAIARAMLKDAPILVLDEATSSLDAESEQLIQSAFEEASKGRTTIVIAHRLATVKRLDRIIVLEEGRIVEEGTHDALLRKKGRYYDLYTHQRL